MIRCADIREILASGVPLIDVRDPGEYLSGHIPGAVNVPLFSCQERARIGTVYKQVSPEAAIALGYKLVQPKLRGFTEQARVVAPSGVVAVHCWSGGMRSEAFASHLHQNGFQQVLRLSGGYKSYRRHVLDTFEQPWSLKVLGGYTGSGKTRIIQAMRHRGVQALDLEDIGKHRGSAFGGLASEAQPTTEQFENNLHLELSKMDPEKPIWMEDESHNIGGVNIPMSLFRQMQSSPLYFMDIPRDERAMYLVSEYGKTDPSRLAEGLQKISKRLGGLRFQKALEHLRQGNMYEVALLTLEYYDKCYARGLSFREPGLVRMVPHPRVDTPSATEMLLTQYA